MTDKEKKLLADNPISTEIEKSYKVVGIVPGEISWKGIHYDLRTIDKNTADQLVKEGFPNLAVIKK